MKNIVKIRNVVFGEGIPKICIPLTDANIEELSKSVNELKSAPFDMLSGAQTFLTISKIRKNDFRQCPFSGSSLATHQSFLPPEPASKAAS